MNFVLANGVRVEVMCVTYEHEFLSGCAFSNVSFTFTSWKQKTHRALGAGGGGSPTR